MTKPTLLTEEEAADLLSDGSDYIGYWADITESVSDEIDHGTYKEITFRCVDDGKEYTVNIQAIREAAYRVVNEKLIADYWLGDLATGDYDAVSADAVIQVAALGEVVYG